MHERAKRAIEKASVAISVVLGEPAGARQEFLQEDIRLLVAAQIVLDRALDKKPEPSKGFGI